MLSQIEIEKELQFLAYLVPVIIGIQLALYFFYQYHKNQDETLPLNRVLLAFGSFILFIILGPLLIQISRNFILDGFLFEFLSRMGWFFAFFSTISVSIFIIRKDFSFIINLNIARILMILNFLPLIIVFLDPTLRSPIFVSSIFFVVLNGLYIIRFQLILINKSVGSIKKKIRLFLIGAIVSLFALFFAVLVGLRILSPVVNELIYFIGVGELFIGFIIISFSIHNFPPFYEFEWRKNLIQLLIVNEKNKVCLYSYNFIEKFQKDKSKSQIYDRLFSKGILGIETIIATITGIRNDKIYKIKQEGSQVFLDYGSYPANLVYVLVVKKDLDSTHHLLKSIRMKFESFFKEILLSLDNLKEDQEQIFGSFDPIIKQILQQ